MKYYPVQVSTLGGYVRADVVRLIQDVDFWSIRAIDWKSDYLFGMPQYRGEYQVIPFPTFNLDCLSDTEYFDEFGTIHNAEFWSYE
jgi:hypothetical protein